MNAKGKKVEVEQVLKNFNFYPAKQNEQIVKSLLEEIKYCHLNDKFIATVVLAGITTEFAHRTKLEERGKEIKNKTWKDLIDEDNSVDQSTKDLLHDIRKKYRNPWIHFDLKELETHANHRFSDMGMYIASISAKDALESLKLLMEAIKQIYPKKVT